MWMEKKKRGEDMNEEEIALAKKKDSERISQEEVSEDDEGNSVSVLPKHVKFP